jgi:uncharacterized protein YdhG (YjbR/CyaY superfamily)
MAKRSRPQSQSIDDYLASLPATARSGLQKLRDAIRAAAPAAEESFSYGMPAFRLGGRPLVAFAAAQHHSSFFPMSPAIIRTYADELKR